MKQSHERQSDSEFQHAIVNCIRCPRLIEWCQQIAQQKVRRFQADEYWGKPVPSFGEMDARMLIVGLAPAAHGANRTGRMFTGDRSGEWLYGALFEFGFCSQPTSFALSDGLKLFDCRITAIAHCAPPQNTLYLEEIMNCRTFLETEMGMMKKLKIVIALGQTAYHEVFRLLNSSLKMPTPKFFHGVESRFKNGPALISSYHPSQQNTFTGKLTKTMFFEIFQRARNILNT